MPRSKKALNEWLASIGVDLTKETIAPTPIEKEPSTQQMAKWEAQSLLTSLNWPYPELVPVVCLDCNQEFLTNYKANTYCSMLCYKTALEKRGLVWRPERTFFEQWGNLEPPLMISPEQIKAMRRLLNLIDQGNLDRTRNQEQQDEYIPEASDQSEVSLDLPTPDIDPEIQSEPEIDQDAEFLRELDAL